MDKPEKHIESGLTMPAEIIEMIKQRGMLAVFIPTDEGVRFFVAQGFTPQGAEELALIMEDCAKTIRSMFRDTGRLQ